MGTFSALLFATPIFFALSPPSLGVGPTNPPAGLGSVSQQLSLSPAAVASSVALPATLTAVQAPAPGERAEAEEGSSSEESGPSYGEQLKRRAEVAKVHKPLGITTWASMTLTLALGTIQYYNLYGFGDGRGSNPCVTGDAVFGQGQCTGTPWIHLSSALVTTALYLTTFTYSLLMPDPGGLSEGDSEYAKKLRTHKLLRWVHMGGMVAQLLLGIVIANGTAFGLDRANDYKTLRALSTVHLGIGLVTWGALTWAGAIQTF